MASSKGISLRATDLGECFVFAVGAGLAAAHMIGGEKRPACTREEGKKFLHTLLGIYVNLDFPTHGGSMTQLALISSVCVERNVRIVV